MSKKINYFNRNFVDVRSELINFIRQYYPEILSDFNDASVGMMLLELNAAVADMLSFHTDRMFQETQLDFAQERNSILSIARTFGLKIPGKRPSISLVDFSVTVPVNGDTFDISYAPVIRRGVQVSGGGKVFESVDDIDFSSPFTTGGLPNRLVIPNIDSNNNIINYTLTKREIVLNGSTKIYKRVINENDVRPFFELVLPDNDVISIDSIITLEGVNYSSNPNLDDFYNLGNRWFEMPALAEDKVFIEDNTVVSDNAGVKAGKWIRVDRKFISEFTNNGFSKITFGGGNQDVSSLYNFNVNPALVNRLGDFINNLSLGVTPTANQTMFIQYRVGGGSNTNLGSNTLTSINLVNMVVDGENPQTNLAVRNSLSVNNPVPAMGGKDEPSIEEIRNLIKYNFASQNRAVTIKDYQTRIALMSGEFGVPFRCGVHEEQNKVIVSILGLDSNSKLTSQTTSTLQANIAEYLSDYRMLNDFVEVRNGRVINLAFEVDLYVDKQFSKAQIISQVITNISDYLNINNQDMGVNIYLGQLLEFINNVPGVINVIDLRVYNKVGGGVYSMNEISQPYIDEDTRQIDISGEYTLFGTPNSMFEIRENTKDIKVRVKN